MRHLLTHWEFMRQRAAYAGDPHASQRRLSLRPGVVLRAVEISSSVR